MLAVPEGDTQAVQELCGVTGTAELTWACPGGVVGDRTWTWGACHTQSPGWRSSLSTASAWSPTTNTAPASPPTTSWSGLCRTVKLLHFFAFWGFSRQFPTSESLTRLLWGLFIVACGCSRSKSPPAAFQIWVKENCYTCRRVWDCNSRTMVSFIPASAIYFMHYWAYIERGLRKMYAEGTNSKLFSRFSHIWTNSWFWSGFISIVFSCLHSSTDIVKSIAQSGESRMWSQYFL